jgi:preprotein translocase subunit SecE
MAENAKTTGKKNDQQGKTFWKGVKAEFGKIIWTDRQTLLKQTGVVTVVTIILGVLISIMDAGILQVLNLLIR